ncbi:MAG: hypothetical protein KI790_13745 [Cyclobacteriaceae bacterium]|nr:hypothetical protein [Cyclobacteriaceae bacterium HetDA_MAG_MS6]
MWVNSIRIQQPALVIFLVIFGFHQGLGQTVPSISPLDTLPPYIRQVTEFGQRADWSHDGQRILFLEKTFGDVFEVEVATGTIRPMTHHFFHEGFVRALYLANGDILLSGAPTFDAKDPWRSRDQKNAELWVLKSDLSGPPTPLGVHCKEGPAASRKKMKIAWAFGPAISVAEIKYENGVPKLVEKKPIVVSQDLPSPVKGWGMETQNFRPPHDEELIFYAFGEYIKTEAEVMGINLKNKTIINYSQREDRYDEPEGTFPDGQHILVESNRHRPDFRGMQGYLTLDIYKLTLDGSGDMRRITYFNDNPNYKASNPVVSDDGRYMAFQYAHTQDAAGMGRGILVLDFEAMDKATKK